MSREDHWVEMTRRYVVRLLFLAIFLVVFVAVPDWTLKLVFALVISVIFWFVVVQNSSDTELIEYYEIREIGYLNHFVNME